MPTLDELRRWARGERVEGLPSAPARPEVPKPVLSAGAHSKSGRYKVNSEGTDALLLFGTVFNGEKLSVVVTTPRGRKYMNWILERDFDDVLKAVCRYRLEVYQREREAK